MDGNECDCIPGQSSGDRPDDRNVNDAAIDPFVPAIEVLGLIAYGRRDGFTNEVSADAYDGREAAFDRAVQQLCAAIKANRITAWGRRGIWGQQVYRSLTHDLIPPNYFANSHYTIMPDGWATHDPDAPLEEGMHLEAKDYGDLRFKFDEMKRLWRPPTRSEEKVAHTRADETRLTEWLVHQMRAAPTQPRSKARMQKEAKDA